MLNSGSWRGAVLTGFVALSAMRWAAAQESGQEPANQEKPATPNLQAEIERLRAELQQYRDEVKKLAEAVATAGQKPDDVIAAGRIVFRSACVACHGKLGDGKGPGAAILFPAPREFISGNYKFRSTPTGSLPLDSDLYRTISEGIPGTAMPAWKKLFSAEERWAVIQYIKLFSTRFGQEELDEPLPITQEPPVTRQSIALGRDVYQQMKCWDCHGPEGKGDGPSVPTLKDDKGQKSNAFDFTTGEFHGGPTNADIYRTYTTGVAGTPMPAYVDTVPEEKRWALVQYCRSLVKKRNALDYFFRKPFEPW